MFKWFKKLVSGSSATTAPSADTIVLPKENMRETLQIATVWDVVDRFLTNNPAPTAFGVHALVAAGASNLLEPKELIQVCEKIQEHGYQYPINPTLINELTPAELLEFLRWHGQTEVEQEYYTNEATIRELIQKFRSNQ